MRLIMFDIEGTLVKSNDIDTVCYCKAIQEVLDIEHIDIDWAHYSYVTDSGITAEIVENFLGRKTKEIDLWNVQQKYINNLRYEVENHSRYFEPVRGAPELINSLLSSQNFAVAFATGCWRNAAFLKLEAAGINYQDIPLASADDSYEREAIMIRASELARIKNNLAYFSAVTYIGDGPWDYIASKNLKYDFVGIGSGNRAALLKNLGATHVLADLSDLDYFYQMLGVETHDKS